MNSPAGEFAARAEAVQPLVTQPRPSGVGSIPNASSPVASLPRDIVALEHQPLIPGQGRAGHPAETRQQISEDVRHRHDLGVLPAQLDDRALELGHGQHLRTADLVGLAAVKPRARARPSKWPRRGRGRTPAGTCDRRDHRKERQPSHRGKPVGEIVFGPEHERRPDDRCLGECPTPASSPSPLVRP